MRLIKFRGRRVDNGEWVCGSLLISEHQEKNLEPLHYFICPLDKGYHRVIPETVGQYIGLKDKNGVEICEGDLVAVADYANWEGLYKIIWDEKNLMYMLEDAFGDREKLCEFEEYLVKGNIYENPEFLNQYGW